MSTFWSRGLPATNSVRVLVERNGSPGFRTLSEAAKISCAVSARAPLLVATSARRMTVTARMLAILDMAQRIHDRQPRRAIGGNEGGERRDQHEAEPRPDGEA